MSFTAANKAINATRRDRAASAKAVKQAKKMSRRRASAKADTGSAVHAAADAIKDLIGSTSWPQPTSSDSGVLQAVGVGAVRVDRSNDRETGSEGSSAAGVAELADSMRQAGLLQPIGVVRDNAGGERPYRLVWGHRRLLAAKRLGWSEIPAIELPVDSTAKNPGALEEQVRRARAIENVQRAELNPIERARLVSEQVQLARAELCRAMEERKAPLPDKAEACGYRTWADIAKGKTPEIVGLGGAEYELAAKRLGKTVEWVKEHALLSRLHPDVAKMVLAGPDVLPIPHARVLARLSDQAEQLTLAKDLCGYDHGDANDRSLPASLEQVKDAVNAALRTLATSNFRLDAAFAGKVSCDTCRHNSANRAATLFGTDTDPSRLRRGRGKLADDAGDGDPVKSPKCLAPSCYQVKTEFAADLVVSAAKVVASASSAGMATVEKVIARCLDGAWTTSGTKLKPAVEALAVIRVEALEAKAKELARNGKAERKPKAAPAPAVAPHLERTEADEASSADEDVAETPTEPTPVQRARQVDQDIHHRAGDLRRQIVDAFKLQAALLVRRAWAQPGRRILLAALQHSELWVEVECRGDWDRGAQVGQQMVRALELVFDAIEAIAELETLLYPAVDPANEGKPAHEDYDQPLASVDTRPWEAITYLVKAARLPSDADPLPTPPSHDDVLAAVKAGGDELIAFKRRHRLEASAGDCAGEADSGAASVADAAAAVQEAPATKPAPKPRGKRKRVPTIAEEASVGTAETPACDSSGETVAVGGEKGGDA